MKGPLDPREIYGVVSTSSWGSTSGLGRGVPIQHVEFPRFGSRRRLWTRLLLGSKSLMTLPILFTQVPSTTLTRKEVGVPVGSFLHGIERRSRRWTPSCVGFRGLFYLHHVVLISHTRGGSGSSDHSPSWVRVEFTFRTDTYTPLCSQCFDSRIDNR